jgi:hypothetical protein
MSPLKVLIGSMFAAALAQPAAAQLYPPVTNPSDNLVWMEQQLQRQRLQQLERDVMTLENRMRAEDGIRSLETRRLETAQSRARIASSLEGATAIPKAPSDIPDDWLARSNARVKAASQPKSR